MRRKPPLHACQNASFTSFCDGVEGPAKNCSTRDVIPSAAACHKFADPGPRGASQQAGHPPTAVADRIVQRCAAGDRSAGDPEVGTANDERLGHFDVVAACGPMERSLRGARTPRPGASGSAPAAMSALTTAGPFVK